jgi:hypothetical protein
VSAGLSNFDTSQEVIPTSETQLANLYNRYIDEQIIPSFMPNQFFDQVPVMPSAPVYQEPYFPIQQPMNFTGLPNIPVMPNIPASSFIQPRVEDIISPIRTGSTRRLPQPGLFNLR